MATTLDIGDFVHADRLGTRIAEFHNTWDMLRSARIDDWKEVQKYVFATDTSSTPNARNEWNNKTTIPKLCQIRDNLLANYVSAMFPQRKWLMWEGDDKDSNTQKKRHAIETYMMWAIDRSGFHETVERLVLDYIDYGNAIAMPSYTDDTVERLENEQEGYVGPVVRRLSPLDIVIDPTAPSFTRSPKIVRSTISLGEVKSILEQRSSDDEIKETAEKLFRYMTEVRANVGDSSGTFTDKDEIFALTGSGNIRDYLSKNFVELLTFYGDLYDEHTNTFYKNYVIVVADRHKIISKKPNPSFFGITPMYHAGWRLRQDNLWAMGPLDNLVGMQYRIDHLENMKADCFDQIAYPPLMIKGYVEDFEWGPFERIYVGDDGDVKVLSPDVQVLQANSEIAIYETKMEEMSGSPKEAMGFRTPGEKTAFEVQRLENASARIFQHKIAQFERQVVEPLLNAMLELARRNLTRATIRVFNNETKLTSFLELTKEDITGVGKLRPVAARHFAEKSLMVQNLTNFAASPAGQDQDVAVHFSGLKLARMWETLLDIEDFTVVQDYVRLSERAQGQQLVNNLSESITQEGAEPTGVTPDDNAEPFLDDEGGVPPDLVEEELPQENEGIPQ